MLEEGLDPAAPLAMPADGALKMAIARRSPEITIRCFSFIEIVWSIHHISGRFEFI